MLHFPQSSEETILDRLIWRIMRQGVSDETFLTVSVVKDPNHVIGDAHDYRFV